MEVTFLLITAKLALLSEGSITLVNCNVQQCTNDNLLNTTDKINIKLHISWPNLMKLQHRALNNINEVWINNNGTNVSILQINILIRKARQVRHLHLMNYPYSRLQVPMGAQ